MKGEILIFVSRVLCYGSNLFFANKLAEAFENIGYDTEVCELDFNEDMSEILEGCIGREYTAIVDFNSTLPRLVVDDKIRYLDMLKGPFFNYIVDHPLYHHPVLDIAIKNENIICVDYNHKKYIDKYYKNIVKTLMIPLSPVSAVNNIPFAKRENEVVFLGTYIPSRKVDEDIEKLDTEQKELTYGVIELMYSNSLLSLEEALEKLLKEQVNDYKNDEFKRIANKLYLADMYIRALRREKVISKLLASGIKVTVFGNGWEEFFDCNLDNLIIKNNVDYGIIPEIIANSKIVLNVMPEFKDGVHDRVLTAMLNKAVCVTDENKYINENFTDDYELIKYSMEKLDELPEKINRLLQNPMESEKIALNGYNKAKEIYTWENTANAILNSIEDRVAGKR